MLGDCEIADAHDHSAICRACGAFSGYCHDIDTLSQWVEMHLREKGHTEYDYTATGKMTVSL